MRPPNLDHRACAVAAGFGAVSVLVVGEAVLDVWIEGTASAVSREAPVAAVDVRRTVRHPGGAANAAGNVASLGGRACLATVRGDDDRAALLADGVRRAGVALVGPTVLGGGTWTKTRVVADRQVVARFDEAPALSLTPAADRSLASAIVDAAASCDAVLIADYGSPALTGEHTRAALAAVAEARRVVVDAHQPDRWRSLHPAVVKPNWQEASRVLPGAGPAAALRPAARDRVARAAQMLPMLAERCGAAGVVLTLDVDGALLWEPGAAAVHLPASTLDCASPTGAGDSFAAALTLALASGADLRCACELGVAAGSLSAAGPGTATIAGRDLTGGRRPLLDAVELATAVSAHRAAGRRIVFTSGCFDVLHAGHTACLAEAARHGDVLVVALNDDAGVAALKGPGRPVNRLEDRAAVLAALGTVDLLTSFAEPSPTRLVERIRPDVFVKGADHAMWDLPEARRARSLGAALVTVPLLPQRSTSGVIAACAAAMGGTR